MPVNTPCAEFLKYHKKWARCRAAFDGQDAVKEAGEEYLPKLTGQSPLAEDRNYENYKARATFFNNVAPTVVALTGAVFLKPLRTENIADDVLEMFKDVTLTGVTFEQFAKDMVGQVVSPGRYGVLVDMPPARDGVITRPYMVAYRAESIINWRTVKVDGEEVPILVVLKEKSIKPDPEDPFVLQEIERYRVCRLTATPITNDNPQGGLVYTQQTYEADPDDKDNWIPGPVLTPMRRGAPLSFIPFVPVGPEGMMWDISDPPLMSLVDMNFSHYLTMADLEWALHWTAIPTPVITGVDDDDPVHLGASTALKLSDVNAKAFFMEFSGSGIGTLRETENSKREMMAALGARMLEKGGNPATATEVRLRHAGEHASLSSIAQSCGQALSRAAQWFTWWLSGTAELDPTIMITLNQDFVAMELTAQDLQAAMLAWQSHAISFETFFQRLQRGGFYAEGTTIEEEEAKLRKETDEAMQRAIDIAKQQGNNEPPDDGREDDDDE